METFARWSKTILKRNLLLVYSVIWNDALLGKANEMRLEMVFFLRREGEGGLLTRRYTKSFFGVASFRWLWCDLLFTGVFNIVDNASRNVYAPATVKMYMLYTYWSSFSARISGRLLTKMINRVLPFIFSFSFLSLFFFSCFFCVWGALLKHSSRWQAASDGGT